MAELEAVGCERVFVDHGESSRIAQRPEWVACLDYLRPGDVLVFRALDRIAGSERMAIDTLMQLRDRGVVVGDAAFGLALALSWADADWSLDALLVPDASIASAPEAPLTRS